MTELQHAAQDASQVRVPPHQLEAEHGLLGGLLNDRFAMESVAGIVGAADFYKHSHRLIFAAMQSLLAVGSVPDPITVADQLRAEGHADEEFGGLQYLHELSMCVPWEAQVAIYAKIVADRAALRRVIAEADEIAAAAFRASSPVDIVERVTEARAAIERHLLRSHSAPRARPITLDFSALRQRPAPPREWIVPGWLGFDPTLLAAGGGVGKSLLSQAEATALSVGRSLIGTAARPHRCMVLNCEDDAHEIARRHERITRQLAIDVDEPGENLILQSRRGCDNLLMYRQGGELRGTPALEALRQEVNDRGIEVLVLDNVAHLFGGDEINRAEVTAFINAMTGLVVTRPFSVVMLAHTARQTGSEFAGSAAWENACRMRWYLSAKAPGQKGDDDEDTGSETVRYLSRRKSNYSSNDVVKFYLDDGMLVPDAVRGGVSGVVAALDEKHAEEVVLAAMEKLKAMGLNPSDSSSASGYLPRQAVAKGLADGHAPRDLERAMNRLMGRGVLIRGRVGSYPNRTPREGLIRVEGVS